MVSRFRILERRLTAFLQGPLSVRTAMSVIVTATLLSVLAGGLLITLLDPEEFPNLGVGLWWALQTVTTVGYGDVTPANPAGRIVGAVIMLEAIAFVAIITAAITSNFVERARRQSAAGQEDAARLRQLADELAEMRAQLDRIERTLGER